MRQTTLAAWLEWKKTCALRDCTDETKAALSEWGAPIFLNQTRNTYARSELLLKASPVEVWYEFEAIVQEKTRTPGVTGREWKNHLLRCAQASGPTHDDQRITFEKMITKRLQWEARESAEKERRAREGTKDVKIVSGDEPTSDDPGAIPFWELYADADHGGLDPATAVADAQLHDIAHRDAEVWLTKMELREKLALGCKHVKRSLADPAVLSMAGCKHSVFNEEPQKAMRRFVRFLEEQYPDEDARTRRELISRAAFELCHLCATMLPSENPPASDL